MGEEGKKEEERTKKCHKKEMRGEAASGRGYLPLANNTNTATASQ